ncbi:thioredoxin domain-containing protein [Candidatus Saccharibacteria bacterium]|nr:thioredoxin domain-containing protein [Candidatus Saccharibacteria bacterium]
MNNRFVLILAACVVAFFGVLFFTKKDNSSNGPTSGQLSNHTVGKGSTGVVLVEYGDFECSACYQYYPIIKQIKEKYNDQITFQFKHLPLFQIQSHENALLAAKAAEAAGLQGKFWEMHDSLYENQPTWGEVSDAQPLFEQYASQLGLDVERFKVDMKGEEVNGIVQADLEEAKSLKFNSTPTFVLDGKKLEDSRNTVEYFTEQIDKAIAEKQKSGQQ